MIKPSFYLKHRYSKREVQYRHKKNANLGPTPLVTKHYYGHLCLHIGHFPEEALQPRIVATAGGPAHVERHALMHVQPPAEERAVAPLERPDHHPIEQPHTQLAESRRTQCDRPAARRRRLTTTRLGCARCRRRPNRLWTAARCATCTGCGVVASSYHPPALAHPPPRPTQCNTVPKRRSPKRRTPKRRTPKRRTPKRRTPERSPTP